MSFLYDMGTKLRNVLYNHQWLSSKSYPLPIICVGNLAVGGTGKTPHTEYLIRLLQAEGKRVATLSRGYKRHTKGYHKATPQSTVQDIGDEPWQLLHNHPDITVAVDEDRCHGIEQLLQEQPQIDVILLDDAYQHRAVKAGLNILLTDYHRLYTRDMLLPAGRLRESKAGAQRAQIVIVTKCPAQLSEAEAHDIKAELQLMPHQQLYFTTIAYGEPQPMFAAAPWPKDIDATYTLLALTGIAHPAPMIDHLQSLTPHVEHISFADHHDFTPKDLQHIQQTFAQLPEKKLIITTQKDAARLQSQASQLTPAIQQHLYTLPIQVEFIHEQQAAFDQSVINYLKQ